MPLLWQPRMQTIGYWIEHTSFISLPVYLWQPGYDDKLDECGGEPQWEHTHIVTVVQ